MNLDKRTLIIIGSIIGVLIIALGVVGFLQSNNTTSNESTYTDPGSGEQVSEDEKGTQGTDASLKNSIVFLGFSKLVDRGLTPVQIQSIQSLLSDYSLQQTDKFKEVSLQVDSIRHLLPQGESTTHTFTFDIKVNRSKDYYMTAEYADTASVLARLYASDKTTLLIER